MFQVGDPSNFRFFMDDIEIVTQLFFVASVSQGRNSMSTTLSIYSLVAKMVNTYLLVPVEGPSFLKEENCA